MEWGWMCFWQWCWMGVAWPVVNGNVWDWALSFVGRPVWLNGSLGCSSSAWPHLWLWVKLADLGLQNAGGTAAYSCLMRPALYLNISPVLNIIYDFCFSMCCHYPIGLQKNRWLKWCGCCFYSVRGCWNVVCQTHICYGHGLTVLAWTLANNYCQPLSFGLQNPSTQRCFSQSVMD